MSGKRRAPARPGAWLTVWGALILVVSLLEVLAVASRKPLDTLSETVWWLYGPQFGARWWLIGAAVAALFAWCPVHWWFPSVGARELAWMVAVAVAVGLAGWAVTR